MPRHYQGAGTGARSRRKAVAGQQRRRRRNFGSPDDYIQAYRSVVRKHDERMRQQKEAQQVETPQQPAGGRDALDDIIDERGE